MVGDGVDYRRWAAPQPDIILTWYPTTFRMDVGTLSMKLEQSKLGLRFCHQTLPARQYAASSAGVDALASNPVLACRILTLVQHDSRG
jgi:hypothetical protein